MNSFKVNLSGATQNEEINNVISFTGKDETGSFGIFPNAERRMTSLGFGLAKIRLESGASEYLAFPGGILYFLNNELFIATRLFIRNSNLQIITDLLEKQIRADETIVREVKRSLHQLDQEIFKRLAQESYGLNQ